MNMRVSIPLFMLLQSAALAQVASVPVLGWTIPEKGRDIERVLGVPGAGHIEAGGSMPIEVSRPVLNPSRSIAAAVEEESGRPVLLELDSLRTIPLDGSLRNPDAIVWSPSGSALALLYRNRQTAQVFSTDASGVRLSREFSIAADTIAVSDSGSSLLARLGTQLSLYRVDAAAVLARESDTAFTFLSGSEELAYYDGNSLIMRELRLTLSQAPSETLFLASTAKRDLLVVRSSGRVLTINGAGETVAEGDCQCRVSGLAALGYGAMRLRTDGDGPLWVVTTSGEPRLYFVPRHPVIRPKTSPEIR